MKRIVTAAGSDGPMSLTDVERFVQEARSVPGTFGTLKARVTMGGKLKSLSWEVDDRPPKDVPLKGGVRGHGQAGSVPPLPVGNLVPRRPTGGTPPAS